LSLRRDDDFVVPFAEDIVRRSRDPGALRKICGFLRWKTISDTSIVMDGSLSVWTVSHIAVRQVRSFVAAGALKTNAHQR
jgi:hypothetical protein